VLFRLVARCIIYDEDGGRLLVQLSKRGDFYRLPGGRVRAEETLIQALERELREELGFKFDQAPPLVFIVESFFQRKSGIVHELGFYFLCEPGSNDIRPKEEHLKIVWVPIGEIHQDNFRPRVLAPYIRKLPELIATFRSNPAPTYLINIDLRES
jgi:8-oxo-dGTP pyrophosphatase MutT (NUDIX family)